jgi:hypothetical protein
MRPCPIAGVATFVIVGGLGYGCASKYVTEAQDAGADGAPATDGPVADGAPATDGPAADGAPATDGPVVVVASGYRNVGLTASADTVFWVTSDRLYSAALLADAGVGAPTELSSEGGFQPELAWTGSQIVTATDSGTAGALKFFSPTGNKESQISGFGTPFGGHIPRVGIGGLACANASFKQGTSPGIISGVGSPHDVANTPDGPFLDLAVDATKAYWTTGASAATGPSGVKMSLLSNVAPANGGASAQLFAASPNAQGLVVQGGFVTWTDFASPPRVLRCKVSGCGAGPTVVFQGDDGVHAPSRIVATSTDLYWIDVAQGTVATCPVAGCAGAPPRIVASGLVQPMRIALSARRVLIADWADPGRIISAPQ